MSPFNNWLNLWLQTLAFIRGGQIIAKSANAENKPLPSAKDVLDSDISLYIAPGTDVRENRDFFTIL